MIYRIFILIAVFSTISTPVIAQTDPATPSNDLGRIVDQVQAFYDGTLDLKGNFKQVYTDTLYQRKRVHYGYMYLKKPGLVRWNYIKPDKKAFIIDGKQVWLWEPEDNQVFKNPIDQATLSSGGLSFLLGSGRLKDEYNVEFANEEKNWLGAPDSYVLKLLPKKPTAQLDYLLLAIDPKQYLVTESMLVTKHAKNHFVFTELKQNTKLPASRFRFSPPSGSRVIDGSNVEP